jgi:hypothetical protein
LCRSAGGDGYFRAVVIFLQHRPLPAAQTAIPARPGPTESPTAWFERLPSSGSLDLQRAMPASAVTALLRRALKDPFHASRRHVADMPQNSRNKILN